LYIAAMPDTQSRRREALIASQLAALRDLGLPQAMLAREEALLRGGLAAGQAFAKLLEPQDPRSRD
jgi:hypothetical protein